MEKELIATPNGSHLLVVVTKDKLKVESCFHNSPHRRQGVLSLIEKAINKLDLPNNFRSSFNVNVRDKPLEDLIRGSYGFWTEAGKTDNYFPAFCFDRWPRAGYDDYNLMIRQIVESSNKPPVERKVFWSGDVRYSESRITLYNIGQNNPMCHFRKIEWEADRLTAKGFVPLVDHSRYAALLDIEGFGYSGRLPFLLATGRPVLICDRQYEQKFFFDGSLRPWEHYIPVRRDLDDLEQKVEWVFNNYEYAAAIGRDGQNFALENLSQDKMVDQVVGVILANNKPYSSVKPRLFGAKRGASRSTA